jgi:hypothetical protein
VLTSTTLGHFPRKEMAVWRRFSDFEWLNRRLALTFPAAIIPIFPEKRLVGSSDAAITAERAVALEAYANKVVTHAVLSHALDVLIFLDATDAGLDASKTFIEAVEKDEAESIVTRASDLVSKLGSRGDETRLVLKPDEAYVSVRRRPRAGGAARKRPSSALRATAVAPIFSPPPTAGRGRARRGAGAAVAGGAQRDEAERGAAQAGQVERRAGRRAERAGRARVQALVVGRVGGHGRGGGERRVQARAGRAVCVAARQVVRGARVCGHPLCQRRHHAAAGGALPAPGGH